MRGLVRRVVAALGLVKGALLFVGRLDAAWFVRVDLGDVTRSLWLLQLWLAILHLVLSLVRLVRVKRLSRVICAQVACSLLIFEAAFIDESCRRRCRRIQMVATAWVLGWLALACEAFRAHLVLLHLLVAELLAQLHALHRLNTHLLGIRPLGIFARVDQRRLHHVTILQN